MVDLPHQNLFGFPLDVKHLHVTNCVCFVHINVVHNKWGSKSLKCDDSKNKTI